MTALPDHAPSRTLKPEQWPRPAATGPRLAALGVDAGDLAALLALALAQGWGYRLVGVDRRHLGAVSVPGFHGEGAASWASRPEYALASAIVQTLDAPPPPAPEDDLAWLQERP